MFAYTRSTSLLPIMLMALTGCSGSGGGNAGAEANNEGSGTDSPNAATTSDLLGEIPAGDITLYGAITVGDDAGIASDLVGAFFKLDEGVSGDFLKTVFSSNKTLCTVDDDDQLDFEEISVGFIPSFNGVTKQAISAGESIELTSAEGTFASMESQSGGVFMFYTLPNMQMLPSGSVPEFLQVDVAGDTFPSYQGVSMPSVEPLAVVGFTGGDMIRPTSVFSWIPAAEPGSMVRIFSSTAGGFFLEDGMTVTCLVPDTGSFSFPPAVQAKLGAGFVGATPIFSRVAVRTESDENSTLFLIRESFTN